MAPATLTPVTRRTVAQGLAWAVPTLAGVTAAPAMAASASARCTYTAQFVTNQTGVTSLIATSPSTSRQILVTLTQQTGPCTTVTPDNMTTGGEGTQQASGGVCCGTARFAGFGPPTAITLNQVTTNTNCVRPVECATTHDSQTVTFTFLDPTTRGSIGAVGDVQLTVFDITSVNSFLGADPESNAECSQWRGDYYDAVGFNVAPSQIIPSSMDRGTGAGTTADPFRRSAGNMPTVAGQQWLDTFVFASVAGPLTLTYSNLYYGYHFVALSALQFQGPC